jgi:ribose/xylose/arabinose/galactoside ABC-type transport system permease subunit
MYKLKQFAVKYSVMVVMVFLIIIFSFMSPVFLTWQNIINLINQNTYFIIAAVGLAFVMIGGGIDLSVGYQMSLVGVITAIFMTELALPVWLSVIIGLITGTVLGMIIGVIVTKLKIFPLIVTLAMSTVYQGISYQISQAKTYRQFPLSFRMLSTGGIFGIRFDVLLAFAIVLIAVYIFKYTYLGRHIFAVGGNREAARLSGISVIKITVLLYSVCGFLFAMATMDMISKSNTTASNFGPGTEFTCMTAAIIGGISFKGGKGNMGGLVVGVFVLQILGNGMQLAGLGTYSQYIV